MGARLLCSLTTIFDAIFPTSSPSPVAFLCFLKLNKDDQTSSEMKQNEVIIEQKQKQHKNIVPQAKMESLNEPAVVLSRRRLIAGFTSHGSHFQYDN